MPEKRKYTIAFWRYLGCGDAFCTACGRVSTGAYNAKKDTFDEFCRHCGRRMHLKTILKEIEEET